MKNQPTTLSILNELTAGYRRYALAVFAVMVMAAFFETLGLSMILPVLSGLMGSEQEFSGVLVFFDWITRPFSDRYGLLVQLCVMVAAIYAKNVSAILLRGMSSHFAMRLREIWSVKLFFRYLRDRYERVLDRKQGVMLHNAVEEPFKVAKAILLLLNLATKLIFACGLIVLLVSIDWKVTFVLTAIAGLIYIVTSTMVFTYSVRFGKRRLEIIQDINSISAECLGAVKEVKIFGQEGHYCRELRKRLALFTKIQVKFSIFSHLPENLIEICAVTGIVLVVGYVYYGFEGQSALLLSKVALFVVAGQKLFNCLSYMISQYMKFSSALPGMQLIHSIITRSTDMEELDKGEVFDKIDGDLVFENVGFSYGGGHPVFNGYNMCIPANRMTAIVGPSGVGKSTIADLLLGLLEPGQGKIFVNGRNLSDFSLDSWRKKVGYVGQDPVVFNASIRANILAGRPDAGQEEVERAARIARIHDFVVSLADGYDTVVGDKGAKLSGGQRQRIVIARAIIRDPELFVFDEATSALDRETEADITRAMEKLAGHKTIVVIAHRLSTIKNADVVYDLGDHQPQVSVTDHEVAKALPARRPLAL